MTYTKIIALSKELKDNRMSKLRVVIIEDEFFAADHLKDLVTSLGHEVVSIDYSGEDFLKSTDWKFDLAIVDILLAGELKGIEVAAQIQAHELSFIFLTANQDDVTLKKAAMLKPKAYITKPFNPKDVSAALQIVAAQRTKMIEVRLVNGIEEINPNDVLFIKSDGAYVEIQLMNRTILQRKLLKEIAVFLPLNFVRVHRSYIVNRDFIERRSASEIHIGVFVIPISRSYKKF
jgi:DNA-binding LytR/AlgR family response regulator